MRAILQRVKKASVSSLGETIGQINGGWLVLFGVGKESKQEDLSYLVDKTLNIRAFPDSEGKMNHSVLDIKGEILVVSQFTLYGDCRKGRRPSFSNAGEPSLSEVHYEDFVAQLRKSGLTVETGSFGAKMEVSLNNDGPVTFILDASKTI